MNASPTQQSDDRVPPRYRQFVDSDGAQLIECTVCGALMLSHEPGCSDRYSAMLARVIRGQEEPTPALRRQTRPTAPSSDATTWYDRDGKAHEIATMDASHAFNVIAFLERRAVGLLHAEARRAFCALPLPEQTGEMAYDILERGVHELWDRAERATTDPQLAIDWLWESRRDMLDALTVRTVPA